MRQKLIHLKWIFIYMFGCGFTGFVPLVQAQTGEPDNNGWHFELTPYLWATSQDGKIGLDKGPGNGVPLNQSFSDILRRMDMGGMALFDVRKDRWGLLLDGIYLKISDRGQISGPNGFVTLSAHGDVTQKLFSAAGYYRAIEGKTNLDMMLGLRYHAVEWDVNANLSLPPAIPSISRRFNERKNWTDPFAGVRLIHKIDDHWSVMGYGDVGGSGSGSDLTWQAIGGVNYTFASNMVGKLGYRHLSYDYHRDGFKYDVDTSGFYVGLGFTW